MYEWVTDLTDRNITIHLRHNNCPPAHIGLVPFARKAIERARKAYEEGDPCVDLWKLIQLPESFIMKGFGAGKVYKYRRRIQIAEAIEAFRLDTFLHRTDSEYDPLWIEEES